MADLLRGNTGAARLRELLRSDELTLAPGAFDALSARLVEQAGFDVVYMTGYGASASLLGRPDVGLLSSSEMADQARRFVHAVDVPVIADADNGYGGPLNVIRAVQELGQAGVAALHIEDQVIPKRCGHMQGKRVVSQSEKVHAAVEARGDSELLLIARSDARNVEGLDSAVTRVGAYLEAGADLLFIDALESEEEAAVFGEAYPGIPKIINWVEGGATPLIDVERLAELGFRVMFCSLVTLFATTRAMQERLAILRRIGSPQPEEPLAFHEFNELIGLADVNDLDARFLAGSGSRGDA